MSIIKEKGRDDIYLMPLEDDDLQTIGQKLESLLTLAQNNKSIALHTNPILDINSDPVQKAKKVMTKKELLLCNKWSDGIITESHIHMNWRKNCTNEPPPVYIYDDQQRSSFLNEYGELQQLSEQDQMDALKLIWGVKKPTLENLNYIKTYKTTIMDLVTAVAKICFYQKLYPTKSIKHWSKLENDAIQKAILTARRRKQEIYTQLNEQNAILEQAVEKLQKRQESLQENGIESIPELGLAKDNDNNGYSFLPKFINSLSINNNNNNNNLSTVPNSTYIPTPPLSHDVRNLVK